MKMLFAYIGPETMMPIASVFVAAAGIVMMFGRNLVALARGLGRRLRFQPKRKGP
jgi:hypothetical protein